MSIAFIWLLTLVSSDLCVGIVAGTVHVSWEELHSNSVEPRSEWVGSLQQLRGFLYRNSNGHLVLSDIPNLKSCCIDEVAKHVCQVMVKGNVEPGSSGQAVVLNGVLRREDGGPWILEDAVRMESFRRSFTGSVLLGLGAAVAIFALFVRKRCR